MPKSKKRINIVERSYNMNLQLYKYVRKFPRDQKMVLGNKILKLANNILEKLIDASYLKDDSKTEALNKVDLKLKSLQTFIRFAKDLSFLSYKGYEYLSKNIVEIGKMLGGWKKWQEKTSRGEPVCSPDKKESYLKNNKQKKKGVTYTLKSPVIKKYLEIKVNHPQKIIAIKTGIFYKLFFEDAKYFRNRFNFKLRNLAAESESAKIESCGFPVNSLKKYNKKVENLMAIGYNSSVREKEFSNGVKG